MIPRYSRPAMAALWTEEAKLERWLEVELAVCRAWAARGVDPGRGPGRDRGARPRFTVERTQELERTTNHDVVAFLTDVNEHIGPGLALGPLRHDLVRRPRHRARRWRSQRSGELLLAEQAALTATLRDAGRCATRTPSASGARTASTPSPRPSASSWPATPWRAAATRSAWPRRSRGASVGKLSGAVGTYAMLDPRPRGARCWPSSASAASRSATQVVARDRHAQLVVARWPSPPAPSTGWPPSCATCSAPSCARPRRPSRRARRAARRCPTSATRSRPSASRGLARVVRGHAVAALEDVALWHERDISHSSVERIILPDAFLALDYMLARAPPPGGGAGGAPGADAGGARVLARPRLLAAGAARAGRARPHPRGGLRPRAAQRDARLGRGPAAGRPAGRRRRGDGASSRPTSWRRCSTRPGTRAMPAR